MISKKRFYKVKKKKLSWYLLRQVIWRVFYIIFFARFPTKRIYRVKEELQEAFTQYLLTAFQETYLRYKLLKIFLHHFFARFSKKHIYRVKKVLHKFAKLLQNHIHKNLHFLFEKICLYCLLSTFCWTQLMVTSFLVGSIVLHTYDHYDW